MAGFPRQTSRRWAAAQPAGEAGAASGTLGVPSSANQPPWGTGAYGSGSGAGAETSSDTGSLASAAGSGSGAPPGERDAASSFLLRLRQAAKTPQGWIIHGSRWFFAHLKPAVRAPERSRYPWQWSHRAGSSPIPRSPPNLRPGAAVAWFPPSSSPHGWYRPKRPGWRTSRC